MITIFCDFRQFSMKKLAFFTKTNVMINLKKLALFWVKNANVFAKFFGENILKIITSVPGNPTGPWNCIPPQRKQYSGSRLEFFWWLTVQWQILGVFFAILVHYLQLWFNLGVSCLLLLSHCTSWWTPFSNGESDFFVWLYSGEQHT
jgi:hypothetical protein